MNYEGTARTGWDSAEPNLFTMIIIINKDSNKVVAWKMVNDGTKRPEYFTVPEEKINSYMNVEITGQDVFDNFTEGLVYNLEVELEEGKEIMIAATVFNGLIRNISSQHTRQCLEQLLFLCKLLKYIIKMAYNNSHRLHKTRHPERKEGSRVFR